MSGEKSEKKKTGLELGFVFNFFRDFNAATGQQLWFLNSKMSTNSPEGHQFFGILMWIVTELSRKTMSLHSRVSAGVTFLDFERISPNLKEPKKCCCAGCPDCRLFVNSPVSLCQLMANKFEEGKRHGFSRFFRNIDVEFQIFYTPQEHFSSETNTILAA